MRSPQVHRGHTRLKRSTAAQPKCEVPWATPSPVFLSHILPLPPANTLLLLEFRSRNRVNSGGTEFQNWKELDRVSQPLSCSSSRITHKRVNRGPLQRKLGEKENVGLLSIY